MDSSNPQTDVLCESVASVRIKHGDREERRAEITIQVAIRTVSTPVHKRVMVVRLTEEDDPFFLYTLEIGEDDYGSLKTELSLVVDFADFPAKFIDLLQTCIRDATSDSPRFVLQLATGEPHNPATHHHYGMPGTAGMSSSAQQSTSLAASVAQLRVVEINNFRHMTVLSLRFMHGTDASLKKFLATCLKEHKTRSAMLASRLAIVEADLKSTVARAEQRIGERSQECESLKFDLATKLAEVSQRHTSELAGERERHSAALTEVQQRLDRERRESDDRKDSLLRATEQRLLAAESLVRELTSGKATADASLADKTSRLVHAEEELAAERERSRHLAGENKRLEAARYDMEKEAGRTGVRIAALQQEVKDKDEAIKRMVESTDTANEQKRRFDEAIVAYKSQITRLEDSVASQAKDITKANEIIQRLQSDIAAAKAKLKMRGEVTIRQERLLEERQAALEKHARDEEQLKVELSHVRADCVRLESEVAAMASRVEEARKVIESNQNLIDFLNRQLNDVALDGMGAANNAAHMSTHPPRPWAQQRQTAAPSTQRSTVNASASSAQYPLPSRATQQPTHLPRPVVYRPSHAGMASSPNDVPVPAARKREMGAEREMSASPRDAALPSSQQRRTHQHDLSADADSLPRQAPVRAAAHQSPTTGTVGAAADRDRNGTSGGGSASASQSKDRASLPGSILGDIPPPVYARRALGEMGQGHPSRAYDAVANVLAGLAPKQPAQVQMQMHAAKAAASALAPAQHAGDGGQKAPSRVSAADDRSFSAYFRKTDDAEGLTADGYSDFDS